MDLYFYNLVIWRSWKLSSGIRALSPVSQVENVGDEGSPTSLMAEKQVNFRNNAQSLLRDYKFLFRLERQWLTSGQNSPLQTIIRYYTIELRRWKRENGGQKKKVPWPKECHARLTIRLLNLFRLERPEISTGPRKHQLSTFRNCSVPSPPIVSHLAPQPRPESPWKNS